MSSPLQPHAVHRLHQYRLSLATKAFAARGHKLIRCPLCLLSQTLCTCSQRKQLKTQSAFLLLMYDGEVLKPTNSGRLIADLIPQTHAFLWSRTDVDAEMLAILADPQYQPFVVFPGSYADAGQTIVNQIDMQSLAGKRPLFIMLDGSWREAVKMFRKSPYLQGLPMLSFDATQLARYALRKGQHDFQFGTAEVAVMALDAMAEHLNSQALNAWFELFVEASLLGRNRRPKDSLIPIAKYIEHFNDCYQATLS
ncbi:tRNA-uridine aminocarboxypropyltransferase [Shewanella sp. NIFS-20-20]|uniref:tRNA-uridine aminocarboxypropyltransferase n=1 Tax=Shewanella sp. NIFS-20-20 TaxID=2853806 RepID=UPI001C48AB09|nr:DTW domain-containing protein [Shewanella sp. NIFS-20-20]MBV7316347.1 DTW domain-containing protein [Shewanella sp. NIFS-20-20]